MPTNRQIKTQQSPGRTQIQFVSWQDQTKLVVHRLCRMWKRKNDGAANNSTYMLFNIGRPLAVQFRQLRRQSVRRWRADAQAESKCWCADPKGFVLVSVVN